MNLLSRLSKPAWQSSNPSKRAAAVATAQQPELIAALPALAVEDSDPDVRQHALRRCDDPALYGRAAGLDDDAGLRAWARERWLQALSKGRLPLDDGVIAALDRQEIEQLATQLPAADARRALLARIERPGFLAERVLADPDAELRLELLARIDQVGALERIADQARKRDKRLYRAARERIEQLQLAAGSGQVHRQRAEAICSELESLLRQALPRTEREARLMGLRDHWSALDHGGFAEALHARYRGACEVIEAQLRPPVVVPVTTHPEVDFHEQAPPAPSPEEVAAQARLQSELAALAEVRAREQALGEEQRRVRQQARQDNERLLPDLAAHLEQGDLGRARQIARTIDLDLLGASARERWQELQPQLKQMQDWEHWANNKVRARLCDEIGQLPGSGVHPDALATKVREAQQRWRELDALEGRGEDAEPSGLDKRFRVVCARALKPARSFFEKRDAIRDEQRRRVEAFLDHRGADGEDATLADLIARQRQAVDHLRDLGNLVGPVRKRLAERLRALLDSIKPRVEAGLAEIEQARQSLVDEAAALSSETDARRIGARARELNQRWKAIGKGRQGRDQAQWRRFRAALDGVFAGLDSQRQERAEELEQRRGQGRELIDELQLLAQTQSEALLASQARVRELGERWRALALRDDALAEAYDSVLTLHRQALRDLERERQRERLRTFIDMPVASAETTATSETREQALHLCFEAETLAGISPPETEIEQQRRWQLQRLERHLRGDRPEGRQGLTEVLERWSRLQGLGKDELDSRRQRLLRAVDAMLAG